MKLLSTSIRSRAVQGVLQSKTTSRSLIINSRVRPLRPVSYFQSSATTARYTPTTSPLNKRFASTSSSSPTQTNTTSTLRNMADTTVTSTSPSSPTIHGFFETQTSTWQYLVVDPTTSIAAIIDPVLDFDRETQTVSTTTADALLAFIASNNYTISHILETHIHADHLTAASYLQTRLTQTQTESSRPPICAGKRIEQVQTLFATRYSIPTVEHQTAFDKLFDDDETFRIGNLEAVAIHLPGHTPDHLGYHIGDNIFCGDSVFHPDIGTARCDFPGGSAESLYHSGKRLLAMDPETKIWVGHDYPPAERGEEVPYMTVREHREHNKHLREGVEKDEFVRLRRERDQKLGEPRLLHPSLQINVRGGRMPAPASATLREGVEGEQVRSEDEGKGVGGLRLLRLPVRGGVW